MLSIPRKTALNARALFAVSLVGLLGASSVLAGCVTTDSTASSATLEPLGPPDKTVAPATSTTTVPEATTTTAVASLQPLPPTSGPVTTVAGATPTGSEQVYTVVASDTMFGIGRRFGVSPQAIADFNNWSDGLSHPIRPGDVVRIPPAGTLVPAATAPAATAPPATATPTTRASSTTVAASGTYTVVAGDYLTVIARKTGTTVNGIVAANGWSDGVNHLLRPGDVIKLPPAGG